MRNLAESMVRAKASRELALGDLDCRVALGYVNEIVTKMAVLPGQRSLIIVSPGFLTATSEAMTLKSQVLDAAARANVTISTMDARGLYTTNPDISQQDNHSTFSMITGRAAQYQRDSMTANEDVMAELADGTGGIFVHNTNDMEGGFKRLTAAPEFVYLLEFSLQNVKPDGSYHSLKIKLNQDGLKLQARRGYYAPKPPNKK